jgi:hypothetical protein
MLSSFSLLTGKAKKLCIQVLHNRQLVLVKVLSIKCTISSRTVMKAVTLYGYKTDQMRKMTFGLPFVYEYALTCVYFTNSSP